MAICLPINIQTTSFQGAKKQFGIFRYKGTGARDTETRWWWKHKMEDDPNENGRATRKKGENCIVKIWNIKNAKPIPIGMIKISETGETWLVK